MLLTVHWIGAIIAQTELRIQNTKAAIMSKTRTEVSPGDYEELDYTTWPESRKVRKEQDVAHGSYT
jgi:hypothetical protein